MTEEEAFEEYNIDEEETKEWIPKPIDLASKISMAINLIAIVVGVVNFLIR